MTSPTRCSRCGAPYRADAVEGRLAGKITRDDIGLAYFKGEVLLDFQRLDV